ncbi:MAG: hypothetical protein ACI4TJ_05445 [Candidatus Cryptobacteroides sp.]
MNTSKKCGYIAPQVHVLPLETEEILVVSGNMEDYINEDFNWEE